MIKLDFVKLVEEHCEDYKYEKRLEEIHDHNVRCFIMFYSSLLLMIVFAYFYTKGFQLFALIGMLICLLFCVTFLIVNSDLYN